MLKAYPTHPNPPLTSSTTMTANNNQSPETTFDPEPFIHYNLVSPLCQIHPLSHNHPHQHSTHSPQLHQTSAPSFEQTNFLPSNHLPTSSPDPLNQHHPNSPEHPAGRHPQDHYPPFPSTFNPDDMKLYENVTTEPQTLNLTVRTPSTIDLLSRIEQLEQDVKKLQTESSPTRETTQISRSENLLENPLHQCQSHLVCKQLHKEMNRLHHTLTLQSIEHESILNEWRKRVVLLELQLAVQQRSQ